MTEERFKENEEFTSSLQNALNEALRKPEQQNVVEDVEIVEEVEEEQESESKEAQEAQENVDEEEKEEEEKQNNEFKLIPNEWTDSEKQRFKAALENPETKEIAEVMINRYQNLKRDYLKKAEERADFAKKTSEWDEIFDERAKAALKARGIEAPQYVRNLLAVEQKLLQEPVPMLKRLMEAYKVNPKQLVDDDSEDDVVDYDKTITEMKKEIANLKNGKAQSETESAAIEQAYIAKQIRDFEFATDENGEPKYPLFSKVKREMYDLLNSGEAKTLEEAYELSPSVKLAKLEQDAERSKKVNIQEERKKVAQAKKAAKGLTNTRVVKAAPKKMSFEERFKENLRKAKANS